ncbi:hypothetical protein C8R47DRAFT_70334 [Mycena vitilis]|nr:hypothetical protein C8R47DRAFT_322973 [Mycena vitilis]KAJ6464237.1 hypothetical protein C8R47DRAFT_70334 [Mycena vitilis]
MKCLTKQPLSPHIYIARAYAVEGITSVTFPSSPLSPSPPTMTLTASASDGLGRKRKAHEEFSALAMYQFLLQELRKEEFLAGVEEDDWAQFQDKILSNPQLPGCQSQPFTAARSFYQELFEEEESVIKLVEDSELELDDDASNPPDDVYEVAASDLRRNVLWQAVVDHVVIENETSCRTAIDIILLTAMTIAQSKIDEQTSGRVILHQEVGIPPQQLAPGASFHGLLDYAFAFTSAANVADANREGPLLTREGLHIAVQFLAHIRQNLASIQEAKPPSTLLNPGSTRQAAAQAAALCVLTGVSHVTNTLTDGVRWKFNVVERLPNRVPASATPPPPAQSSASSLRRSERLSGLAPQLQEPFRPFRRSETRAISIFEENGRGLAKVLRLLTLPILKPSHEFAMLAGQYQIDTQASGSM